MEQRSGWLVCAFFRDYRSPLGMDRSTRGQTSIMAAKSRYFMENALESSQKRQKLDLAFLGNRWVEKVDSNGQSLAFPRAFQRGLDECDPTKGRYLKSSPKAATLREICGKVTKKGLTLAMYISGTTGPFALVQVTNLWLF